jgi:hypothetical protein
VKNGVDGGGLGLREYGDPGTVPPLLLPLLVLESADDVTIGLNAASRALNEVGNGNID